MQQDLDRTILAVILFLNPIMVENLTYTVWFHGYLFYYLMSFVIVGVLGKYFFEDKVINICDLIIIIVVSFLAGICGLRMFIIVFVPLGLSLIICNLNKEIKMILNRYTVLSCSSILLASIGFAIYLYVLSPRYGAGFVVHAMKTNSLTINSAEIMVNNFLKLPELLLIVLGCDFQNNSFGMLVILKGLTLCFWIIFFILLYKGIKKNWYDVKVRYITAFLSLSLLVTVLLIIFVINTEEIIDDARYLSLAGFLIFPLFSMSYNEEKRTRLIDYFDVIEFLVAGIGIFAFVLNVVVTYGIRPQVSWRMPYIEYLMNNNYEFGLSTYWNANDTIFFSENKIEMQPIEDEIGMIYVASNTKRSNRDRIPQFILLTQEEYTNRVANGFSDSIIYEDDRVVIIDFPK